MPDTLTLQSFLALPEPEQDKTLRQIVTRLLDLGPWHHRLTRVWSTPETYKCENCGTQDVGDTEPGAYFIRFADVWFRSKEKTCLTPPQAQGSWADLAERLREKLKSVSSILAIEDAPDRIMSAVKLATGIKLWNEQLYWYCSTATARERVICLVIALGGMQA